MRWPSLQMSLKFSKWFSPEGIVNRRLSKLGSKMRHTSMGKSSVNKQTMQCTLGQKATFHINPAGFGAIQFMSHYPLGGSIAETQLNFFQMVSTKSMENWL